jgi:hypothetical protein
MEGMLRREITAAGATLGEVAHGSLVQTVFTVIEADADALRRRIDDASQGRAVWADPALAER